MKRRLFVLTISLALVVIVPISYSYVIDKNDNINSIGNISDNFIMGNLDIENKDDLTMITTSIKNISNIDISINNFIIKLYNSKNEIIFTSPIYIGSIISSNEVKPVNLTINKSLDVVKASYEIEGDFDE